MNNKLIYVIVFAVGIIVAATQIVMMFSRMQYMQYRLRKVIGLTPCGGESFCENTSIEVQFKNMTSVGKGEWVNSRSAYIAMAMSLVSGIVGLITIIPLGFVSDKYGRKRALCIAYIGFAIEVVMNGLTMALDLPLWILIVATLPSSLLGNGVLGILSQLYVCITDLTEKNAKITKRRLSVVPSVELAANRVRNSSILITRQPASVASVQSTMVSERLSLIALFESCMSVIMSASMMATGPLLEMFGHQTVGWTIIVMVGITGIISVFVPNTRALWAAEIDRETKEAKAEEKELRQKLLSVGPTCKEENCVEEKNENPEDERQRSLPKQTGCTLLIQAFNFMNVPIMIAGFVLLLGSMVAMTDIPVLTLYFGGPPFQMTIRNVGLTIGLRGIGCSIVTGLFVLFNMFYLQPKLAAAYLPPSQNGTQMNTAQGDALDGPSVTYLDFQKSKMHQAKKMILFILIGVLAFMTASRFLYGIASYYDRPTCFILLFIGMTLNAFQFFAPLIRGLSSSLVSPDSQGRLYALLGFCEAVGSFIGLTSIPAFYASTLVIFPGLVFVLASCILCIAFLLACIDAFFLLRGKYK